VLMSGFGWDKDHTLVKCRREGVKLVIYKPFIVDQLLSAIESTVEERQQAMAQTASGE
jgi:two-component system, sensor histidine kinase SagS